MESDQKGTYHLSRLFITLSDSEDESVTQLTENGQMNETKTLRRRQKRTYHYGTQQLLTNTYLVISSKWTLSKTANNCGVSG